MAVVVVGEGVGVDQYQQLGGDLLLQQCHERISIAYTQRTIITLSPGPGVSIQKRPQPGSRLTRQPELSLHPTRSIRTHDEEPSRVIGLHLPGHSIGDQRLAQIAARPGDLDRCRLIGQRDQDRLGEPRLLITQPRGGRADGRHHPLGQPPRREPIPHHRQPPQLHRQPYQMPRPGHAHPAPRPQPRLGGG